jgi:hypothetical protein
MGKPGRREVRSPLPEHIGQSGGTRGSETSQYPQEEKAKAIPGVVASETGTRLNRARVNSWQALRVRGSGTTQSGLPSRREVPCR